MPRKAKWVHLQAGLLTGGAGLVVLWVVNHQYPLAMPRLVPIYVLYTVTGFNPSLADFLPMLLFQFSLGLASALLLIGLATNDRNSNNQAAFQAGVLAGAIVASGALAWQGIRGLFFMIEIASGGLAAIFTGAVAAVSIYLLKICLMRNSDIG